MVRLHIACVVALATHVCAMAARAPAVLKAPIETPSGRKRTANPLSGLLTARQGTGTCPAGRDECVEDPGSCCPTGAPCCPPDSNCCGVTGAACYATECCLTGEVGCGTACCPSGSVCCEGGGCCTAGSTAPRPPGSTVTVGPTATIRPTATVGGPAPSFTQTFPPAPSAGSLIANETVGPNDPRIVYGNGDWNTSEACQKVSKKATQAGSRMSFRFDGTAVYMASVAGPKNGIFQATLDGRTVTVNGETTADADCVFNWSAYDLANEQHSVEIVFTGSPPDVATDAVKEFEFGAFIITSDAGSSTGGGGGGTGNGGGGGGGGGANGGASGGNNPSGGQQSSASRNSLFGWVAVAFLPVFGGLTLL